MCFRIFFLPGALLDERCRNTKSIIHDYVYADHGSIFQRHYLILTSERTSEEDFMVTANSKGRKIAER